MQLQTFNKTKTYYTSTCTYDLIVKQDMQYSNPSILQPSILRPPLIIRWLDLVLKGNFLC